LGLAVANSLAAVEGGARQIECTVNGIGERAGNAAIEELVMAFHVRSDRFPYSTSVDTPAALPVERDADVAHRAGRAGEQGHRRAQRLRHEAGIHQDGVLKDRRTYEIMRAEDVGAPWNPLVLGKHSGRHAVQKRCADLGFTLEGAELVEVYRALMGIADDRKTLGDDDIKEAVSSVRAVRAS
jgi:2-isopropylmalate synthase